MRGKECQECHWVVVVDGAGRRHLEMRWQPPVTAAEPVVKRAA
ncbi:MAG TPA: hypothetical protein VIG96_07395 [Blastococcus sp.]